MADPTLPSFDLTSIVKQAAVGETAAAKKAQLSPEHAFDQDYQLLDDSTFAAKYGNVAMLTRASQRFHNTEKQALVDSGQLSHEIPRDAVTSVARGTANLVLGTAGLATQLAQDVGPGATINDGMRKLLPEEAAQEFERRQAEATGLIPKAAHKVDAYLARYLTPVSQASEEHVGQLMQRDAAAHAAEADAAGGGVVATAKQIGKDIVSGAEHTLDNPTVLGNTLAAQVPTLGIGAGAKAAVTAEQIAARAAAKALQADARTVLAGGSLRADAARELATRNLVAGVGATEGAGAYTGTAGEILAMSPQDLAERFPDRAAELLNPETAEIARADIAQQAGYVAAAIQGPLATATGRVAARFELNPVTSGVDDAATSLQRLTGNAVNIGQETVEETLQSGSGQLAANAGKIAAGDAETDLVDGVGLAAGQGGAGGFGMSTAFQAPSAASNAVGTAGGMVRDLAGTGFNAMMVRGERIRTNLEAKAEGQRQQAVQETAAVAEELGQTLNTLVPEARPTAAAPVTEDPILSPETLAEVGVDPAQPINRTEMLARTITTLETNKDLSDERRLELSLSAVRTSRELRQYQETLTGDDEASQALSSVITSLANSELVRQIETNLGAYTEEDLQPFFAQLPDAPVTDELAPETARLFERMKEMAFVAPDKFTVEAGEKMLFQRDRMSETEVKQVQLALDFAKIKEQHKVGVQQIQQTYQKAKTTDIVRQEINESGFKGRKSISQHVRDVSAAMAFGHVQVARQNMVLLARFAQHMANKANAADAAAIQQINDGEPKKPYYLNFATLDEKGNLTHDKKAFVNLAFEGGKANIDNIFVDANAVTAAYNSLAQAYPELLEESIGTENPLPNQVQLPQEPTWKSHRRPKVPNAATATDAPAAAPVQQSQPAPTEVAAPAEPVRTAVPADEPASAPASEPVQASAPVDNAVDEAFQRELVAAQAAFEGAAAEEGIDFGSDTLASEEDLATALAMSDEEYLAAVTADNGETSTETSDHLAAELAEREVPSRAKKLREVNGTTLFADGDALYAARGDEVVGMLLAKPSSTEFAVAESVRGQGIGKAMMRELLVRDPLALSGGLSPAARATRLSVLRELRAERQAAAAPAPKTVAERFTGLVQTAGNSTNKLLSSFKLNPKSQGLFARLPDAIAQLRTALQQGTVRELFLPQHRSLVNLSAEQLAALQQVAERFVPGVVEQLNANLFNAVTRQGTTAAGQARRGNSYLPALVEQGAPDKNGVAKWDHTDNLSLHATVFGKDDGGYFIHYQPEIAQAMALAGVHWVVAQINNPVDFDEESIRTRLFNGSEISPELRTAFATMPYYEQPLRTLANELTRILGIQGSDTAPVDLVDGIAKSLAADTVRAMEDAGLLSIQRLQGTQGDATFNFIQWHKDELDGSLQLVRNRLGKPSLLTRLLYPDAQELPMIGKAPTQIPQRVQGSGMPLSDMQKRNLKALNQTAFKPVLPMLQLTNVLGGDNLLRVLGFDFRELSTLNGEHARSVGGKNLALRSSLEKLTEILELSEQYAVENGVELQDVPIHYGWRVVSNGRYMMNGFGPQGDKLAREILSPNTTTVTLSDRKQMDEFHLALAQALGVKTEQKTNEVAIDEVNTFLAEGDVRAVLDLLKDPQDPDALTDALVALGISTPRALHALVAYTEMEKAIESDQASFTTSLAFELDGKTDGPINAMVHFGLHGFSEHMLHQLKQGGFFMGSNEGTTLNEHGKGLGDLYGAGAQRVKAKLKQALETATGPSRALLWASIKQLQEMGHLSVADDNSLGSLDVNRSLAKHGTMAVDYGSGDRSIVAQLAYQMIEGWYQQMSDAMHAGEPLPQAVRNRINVLMGQRWDKKANQWKQVSPPALEDPAKYPRFKFSADQVNLLIQNLRHDEAGIGEMLTQAVRAEQAPVLQTFEHIRNASVLQVAALKKAYTAAYKAKRDELVAAGKLAPTNALSRTQEREILEQFKHLAPHYKLMTTEHGLDVSARDFSGQFELDGRVRKAQSIAGGLSLDINATTLTDPGVRAAPLMTIALGDATMMAQMHEEVGPMLDVFDGLEVTVGEIAERALQVNTAVWNGWQFDAVGAIAESFRSFELDVATLSDVELEDLVRNQLRLVGRTDEFDRGEFEGMANNTIEWTRSMLEETAKITAATKQAIAELPLGVDHMSGGMRPFVKDGVPVTDVVAYVQQRVQEIMAGEQQQAFAPAAVVDAPAQTEGESSPVAYTEFEQRVMNAMRDGVASISGDELPFLMHKLALPKVSRFVYDQIEKLIPADLQVFIGSPQAIARKQAEVLPGVNVTGSFRGMYYRNFVFVTDPNPETLVHELVHATTYGLVRKFYHGGGLNPQQTTAVRQLEKLTQAFLTLDLSAEADIVQRVAQSAREEIREHLANKDTAEAVNEFLAWTLTNPLLANLLRRQAKPKGIVALGKAVLDTVRRLLGLPANAQIESFLHVTLGRFRNLVAPAVKAYESDRPLYQRDARTLHEAQVDKVIDQFKQLVELVPSSAVNQAQADALQRAVHQARQVTEAFLDAGFNFNANEQFAFDMVQAVFASGLPLDPATMNSFQHLYEAAKQVLTVKDFETPGSSDPNEHTLAQQRYNALFNVRVQDTEGKSNLLANFVALGLIYEPVRSKLTGANLPAPVAAGDTLDSKLRHYSTRLFDKLSDASVGLGGAHNQRHALDMLSERLVRAQQSLVRANTPKVDRLAQVETFVKTGMQRTAELIDAKRAERLNSVQRTALNRWIDGLLTLTQGALSDEHASQAGETFLSMVNTGKVPTVIRELVTELVGITDVNVGVANLLNQAKHVVSRVRQRLRDEGPAQVRALFGRELSEAEWQTLHRTVGETDLQALLGGYSLPTIAHMLGDRDALLAAADQLEGQLGANQARYAAAADDLAHFMMTRENKSRGFLYSNAGAMSRLLGQNVKIADSEAARVEPLLDRLVTLRALDRLSAEEKRLTASLLRSEKTGMQGLLHLTRTLVEAEGSKPDAQTQQWNRWKGWVPSSQDPRSEVVLAGPKKAAELLKKGYRKVADHRGDYSDPARGMAYYAVDWVGGQAIYNQGAMQTVEGTVSGVDHITGRSLDSAVSGVIFDERTVHSINMVKRAGAGLGNHNLRPIFDTDGTPIAYERVLNRTVLDAHLRGNKDLSKSIGMWMGRQAEEVIARDFNAKLVDVMKATWDAGVAEKRENEYIAINLSKDPVHKDTWNSIPRVTQQQLLDTFDGPVMVRKEMVNNALGYRSASIADVFSGISALPPEVRDTLEKAAFSLLGENAHKWLLAGERVTQGLVAGAKDWIVVRSGVVAFANIFSNQFQLLMHGLPVTKLVQVQARKVQETEAYLRNERRLAQITVERAATGRPDQLKKLDDEAQALRDANQRLSIWPLIEAGELPSIAEGLSELDEYNILHDVTGWVEKKMSTLPKGLTTAMRYAMISKDTALYQGLSRMIQFGDFMAKAALYDHLIAQGKTSEEALRAVNESFVNYNLLPGRTRDWHESMGLTWFMNYKLRIQKIILRTIRENPLRFLMVGAGAGWLGGDSLISASAPMQNWDYAVGPGQFWRAHDMLGWNQLFD